MAENLLWTEKIRSTLEQNGMLSFFINSYENKPMFIYKRIFQRLSDEFHQRAFETIKDENSKLRTYAHFKKSIGLEKYLLEIKNPRNRSQICKFRLSNHDLMIETGRHHKTPIPKEQRFCPFCPNLVEIHFLLQYPTYNVFRNKLYRTLNNPIFQLFAIHEKLEHLMTHLDENIVKYIIDSFEVRTFLITHPKRNS